MDAVLLDLPFRGTWLVQNSPARRVPSHGTTLFGVTYAIDFIAVDGRGRSAPRTWRTVLSVEAPEVFRGFGEPILAPADGTVVLTHDGEPDHEGRRSQLALVPYALGQARRVRPGQRVRSGDQLGECGNSGNSTEPHVHVQVTDSTDWPTARGLPLAFRRSDGAWVPAESEIVTGRLPA